MISNNTDREWEKFGKQNPYFGVIAEESYQRDRLDAKALEEFFRTGQVHVDRLFETIGRCFNPSFRPRRGLDFGCGVGRLVVPLAGACQSVVGVDVSASMLEEAGRNLAARRISNVELVKSGGDLEELSGRFDFIHSFIVFQHINPERGMEILRRLLGLLEPGGIGALHLTFHIQVSWKGRMLAFLRKRIQAANWAFNLLRGNPLGTPFMQMNAYDLNEVFRLLAAEVQEPLSVEHTNHGGHLGAMILFRKQKA